MNDPFTFLRKLELNAVRMVGIKNLRIVTCILYLYIFFESILYLFIYMVKKIFFSNFFMYVLNEFITIASLYVIDSLNNNQFN